MAGLSVDERRHSWVSARLPGDSLRERCVRCGMERYNVCGRQSYFDGGKLVIYRPCHAVNSAGGL